MYIKFVETLGEDFFKGIKLLKKAKYRIQTTYKKLPVVLMILRE
jgi:hypothetical protein